MNNQEERTVVWEVIEDPDSPAIAIRFDDGIPVVTLNRTFTLDLALERRTLPKAVAQSIELALTDYLMMRKQRDDLR